MTKQQNKHMMDLVRDFVRIFKPKFTQGTVEHPGNLMHKSLDDLLMETKHELVDAWAYLGTIEAAVEIERNRVSKIMPDPDKLEELAALLNAVGFPDKEMCLLLTQWAMAIRTYKGL